MQKLALIGTNVSKSLSAPIYQMLGEIYSRDLEYQHLNITPENLAKTIEELTSGKYLGFNITSPYKSKVFALLQNQTDFDEASLNIGNANTYWINNQTINGLNTDLYGIEQSLSAVDFNDKKTLIIGAGDVTKTVLYALRGHEKNIMLMNRTDRRTEFSPKIEFIAPVEDLRDFDVVIKCTPEQKSYQLRPGQVVFDLNYYPKDSNFLNLAKECTKIDGLSMLIWQAIKNFEFWFEFKINNKFKLKQKIYQAIDEK